MVQEFQVLRCFSCQTFQVQQVKKAKKWTCKVCGEKQSLIKEFGRGAAADCRQHVQKLNALRGEQLQVNTQQLLTQRDEDEKDKNEDVHEALDHKLEEVTHVSRWSKYTDQTAEDQNEEEDENVYTERHQFRVKMRKRKKMSKGFGGDHDSYEDEESGYSGFKRQSYLPLQHEKRFSSTWNKASASKYSSCDQPDDVDSCTRTKLPSSHEAVCHYPTACSSSTYIVENSGGNKQQYSSSYKSSTTDVSKRLANHSKSPSVASPQKFGESTIEKKDSKWNKFLTIVPTQDKEEYDYESHDSSHNDENTKMPYFTKADTGVDSEGYRYPIDGKEDSGVRSRQQAVGGNCVDRNVSYSTTSYTSKSAGFENAVSKHPLLANAPCSILSLNSLFCTNEDFDDTF